MCDIFDIKIFIDIDNDIRFLRRLIRDQKLYMIDLKNASCDNGKIP